MQYNEIDNYVNNILKRKLQKLKVNNYGLYKILDNVKNQLYSIIKNWNDNEFIESIFITVIEEGLFYKPVISTKISNLVVLGIRNSLLETIASIDYKDYGLNKILSDDEIKDITSTAIKYFGNINLSALSKNININEDYYRKITNKYPSAYKSLLELSKCNSKETEREYNCLNEPPYLIKELDIDINEKHSVNYENGISEEFNDSLIYFLKGIKEKNSKYLYIDSFKHLSRNFEKNLKVLEFILTHNAALITNNFYISNSYVSRRKDLIRANHGDEFNEDAIKSLSEISNKYKNELKSLQISIED